MRAGRKLDCAFVSKASFLSNSRSRVLPTDSMMPMDETECSETPLLEAGSVQSLQRVFQPAMDKLCNISNVLMLCLCNFATMLCTYPLTYPLTPLFRGNALWQQSKTLLLVIDVKRFWESGGNVFLIGHKNWIPSALSPSSLSASASPRRHHCFHYQRHFIGKQFSGSDGRVFLYAELKQKMNDRNFLCFALFVASSIPFLNVEHPWYFVIYTHHHSCQFCCSEKCPRVVKSGDCVIRSLSLGRCGVFLTSVA